MKTKGSRLRKGMTYGVMCGQKRLATVKSRSEFDNLLGKLDRSKHKIKLKADRV